MELMYLYASLYTRNKDKTKHLTDISSYCFYGSKHNSCCKEVSST